MRHFIGLLKKLQQDPTLLDTIGKRESRNRVCTVERAKNKKIWQVIYCSNTSCGLSLRNHTSSTKTSSSLRHSRRQIQNLIHWTPGPIIADRPWSLYTNYFCSWHNQQISQRLWHPRLLLNLVAGWLCAVSRSVARITWSHLQLSPGPCNGSRWVAPL